MHLAGGARPKNPHLEIGTHLNIQSKTVNPYNNSFELLVKDLERYKKNGYQVILLSGSRTRAKRLADDLMAEGLNAFIRKTTITR